MTLLVRGGGTEVMGSGLSGITGVQLQAPAGGQAGNVLTASNEAGLMIYSSAGNDTVTVGDASQTVFNGGGTLRVLATAARAGVAIRSGKGQTTLEITTAARSTWPRTTAT